MNSSFPELYPSFFQFTLDMYETPGHCDGIDMTGVTLYEPTITATNISSGGCSMIYECDSQYTHRLDVVYNDYFIPICEIRPLSEPSSSIPDGVVSCSTSVSKYLHRV